MKFRKLWSIFLILICGVISPDAVSHSLLRSTQPSTSDNSQIKNTNRSEETGNLDSNVLETDYYLNNQQSSKISTPGLDPETKWGILNAQLVKQSATYTSNWQSLRTDTNPTHALYLDQSHNWKGYKADISIRNIQRLHVLNGSFDAGINGTNINGVGNAHPFGWSEQINNEGESEQNQSTSYLLDFGYVMVQNEGKNETDRFKHKKHTHVLWNQTVALSPYTDSFYLRFDYRYDIGPLEKYPNRIFLGIFFDKNNDMDWGDRVHAIDLTQIGERNQWFDSGLIGFNVTMPTSFNFAIGIYIANGDANLDLDDFIGEEENARFIRVSLDNVTLVALTKPYPSEVELKASLPDTSTIDITDMARGSGNGIVNHEFWEQDPLLVTFESNTSVLFECSVVLHTINFRNTTWQSNPASEGTRFDVIAGQSVNLTLWTVVSYPSAYKNYQFNVTFPNDWENVTVYDSFPSDVTSQCTIGTGYVEISGPTAAQLGWWQICLQAPNYAKALNTQIFDSTTWQNQTIFRCVNRTRVTGKIGTASQIPYPLNGINTTWISPNQTIWSQVIDNGINGQFNSTSRWFGQTNTSAGLWTVVITWNNGSEVAFDSLEFSLHHRTTLSPIYPIIDADPGTTITGLIIYKDAENNNYLLDETASVTANWTSTYVIFTPNPVQKRWEGNFDTEVAGLGTFNVIVNATQNYYDMSVCNFTIRIIYNTQLSSPNAPWDHAGWGTIKNLTLIFKRYNLTAGWEGVINSSPFVKIDCNWTVGSWTVDEQGDPGFYNLQIETAALPPDTWILNISVTKLGYTSRQLLITLVVGELLTSLTIWGDRSPQIQLTENYELKLQFSDSEGIGIDNATIFLADISPTYGLNYSSVTEVLSEPGNYSVTFTPEKPDVYVIRIEASKLGSENASTVFILAVTEIFTSFEVLELSATRINLGESVIAKVRYEDYVGIGILDANVSIDFSDPQIGLNWNPGTSVPGEPGNYSITISPFQADYYLVVLNATKLYCETKTTQFFLLVEGYYAELKVQGQIHPIVTVGENYVITLSYSNISHGLVGATIQVAYFTPNTGLAYTTAQDLGDGNYTITFTPLIIESFSIVFNASLTNHVTDSDYLTLTSIAIAADLKTDGSSLVNISYGEKFSLPFYYVDNRTKEHISGATIDITISGDIGLSYLFEELTNCYNLTLITERTGSWSLTISANKTNYQFQLLSLEVLVRKISTSLDSDRIGGPLIYLGDSITFEFKYYSTSGMSGAQISVQGCLIEEVRIIDHENGNYSIILTPSRFGEYFITIRFSLPEYEEQSYNYNFRVDPSPILLFTIFVVLMVVAIILYISRRQLQKRRVALQSKMLAARQIFEDARNVLSVLVIHRFSGLPFFSSQMRQDIPSEMVSGFISAISSFRAEIVTKEIPNLFEPFPISDIVWISSTRNTLCVLITLMQPTSSLHAKLIEFSKIIDSEYDTLLKQLMDESILSTKNIITSTLQEIVNRVFDLNLLVPHIGDFPQKVPRRFRELHRAFHSLQKDGMVNLLIVARELVDRGMREEEAYYRILQATKEGYIIAIPGARLVDNQVLQSESINTNQSSIDN